MAIDNSKISESIFKALKSFDLKITLYKDNGESTVDPSSATRFYNEKNNMMVNLETDTEKYLLKVSVGNNIDVSKLRPLLDILRKVSKTYNLRYILRTFGRKISPKDFAFQSILESFTKPYGTVKTSRQRFENATLCIRHAQRVNEEKRGSRTRHIKSIFIENSNGERFKFPYKNIPAARTMCIHVSEGGNPYDERGQTILSKVKELETLKEFYKNQKNILENENSKFYGGIKKRINEIRNSFSRLNNKTAYNKYFEKEEVSAQDTENDILNEFNIELTENDELNNYLSKIAVNIKEQDYKHGKIKSFSKKVIDEESFRISMTIDESDSNHPSNYTFKNKLDEMASWANYFSNIALMAEEQDILEQISKDIYSYDEKYLNLAEKVLQSLSKIAIIENDSSDTTENISESIQEEINYKLSKFDID
jgi:hypothetical protein